MRLLHIAVLREKHEFVEPLAVRFSNQIALTDTVIQVFKCIPISSFPLYLPPQSMIIFSSSSSHIPCLQLGRTALHYAAAQQNAIYDSLVDLGARKDLPDQDGVTAEEYRQNPSRLVRPTSAVSSVMLRSMSTDDEFFDPGESMFLGQS